MMWDKWQKEDPEFLNRADWKNSTSTTTTTLILCCWSGRFTVYDICCPIFSLTSQIRVLVNHQTMSWSLDNLVRRVTTLWLPSNSSIDCIFTRNKTCCRHNFRCHRLGTPLDHFASSFLGIFCSQHFFNTTSTTTKLQSCIHGKFVLIRRKVVWKKLQKDGGYHYWWVHIRNLEEKNIIPGLHL